MDWEEELYTLPQIAQILGVSRSRVYKLVREGKLPAFRLGRQWVVSWSALEASLAAPKERPPLPPPPRPRKRRRRRSVSVHPGMGKRRKE